MNGSNGSSLVPTAQPTLSLADYDGLTMVVSPAEALRRVQELQAFVAKVMKPGLDYGVIPGTPKPSLWQPGAQKLCEMYGFAVSFLDVETIQDWNRPLFAYRKRCVLTSRRDGRFVCDGIGSCNSLEDRYAWRWANEGDIPPGTDKASLVKRTKTTNRGPWVQFRTPNPDIYSLVNTVEKMACKRALIHATLNATRSAGLFTQDIEDLPPSVIGVEDAHRSWEAPAEPDAATEERALLFEGRIEAAEEASNLRQIAADIKRAALPQKMADDLRRKWTAKKKQIDAIPATSAPVDREPGSDD